jgi:hypothetical protein
MTSPQIFSFRVLDVAGTQLREWSYAPGDFVDYFTVAALPKTGGAPSVTDDRFVVASVSNGQVLLQVFSAISGTAPLRVRQLSAVTGPFPVPMAMSTIAAGELLDVGGGVMVPSVILPVYFSITPVVLDFEGCVFTSRRSVLATLKLRTDDLSNVWVSCEESPNLELQLLQVADSMVVNPNNGDIVGLARVNSAQGAETAQWHGYTVTPAAVYKLNSQGLLSGRAFFPCQRRFPVFFVAHSDWPSCAPCLLFGRSIPMGHQLLRCSLSQHLPRLGLGRDTRTLRILRRRGRWSEH